MTNQYVKAILEFPETEFDIWCTFSLAGFNQKEIEVQKKSKGTTTYTFQKKVKMLFQSITNASSKPLFYVFYLGLSIVFLSFIAILYQILNKIIYLDYIIEGWTSLIISIWFLGGCTIFSIGIIGLYLSKVFLEVKNRPVTITKKVYES
jgi:putative glycosyltransferase